MSAARKLGWALAAGVGFGALVATLKGQDAGVRDALGNMSAPWVLIPFLAGTRWSRLPSAALAGLAVTLAAFLGFYTAEAAILALGPHPWWVDLELTLRSGHLYAAWGLLSGPLYGVLGGLWRTRSRLVATLAVPLAFLCEPLLVLLATRTGIWGGELLRYPALWLSELALGLVGAALVLARAGPAPTASGARDRHP